MLDYAARRPAVAKRGASPNAMLLIVAVHVAALAALMSARMEMPPRIADRPIAVDLIPLPKPPPPNRPAPPSGSPRPMDTIWSPPPLIPVPTRDIETVDVSPNLPLDPGPMIVPEPGPAPNPAPLVAPPRAAQLLTPAAQLKPPYPQSKLLREEQAVLKLRLAIDERGRVVSVMPVGRADPAFLDAARRHIVAHWRYRPASEGGRAIVSTAVITLHFELDG